MSNLEKTKDSNEKEYVKNTEKEEEEQVQIKELVLGIPALRVSESYFSQKIRNQAILAAELVVAAAEEAVKVKSKKVTRTRKNKANAAEGSFSSSATAVSQGEAKKLKKKGSELTNPPEGPPMCNICGRGFGSWKAVFGHLRSHKDRNYQGFLPPPKFSAAAEGFAVATSSGQGSRNYQEFLPPPKLSAAAEGFEVATSSGQGPQGGRNLGLDLNEEPVDQEETMESNVKFDLNKAPPKEEEEEKEEDKEV